MSSPPEVAIIKCSSLVPVACIEPLTFPADVLKFSIAPLSNVPPAKGSLVAILFVTVVLKLASSPNAVANSFNVFNVPGAESTKFDTAVLTKAVVAN